MLPCLWTVPHLIRILCPKQWNAFIPEGSEALAIRYLSLCKLVSIDFFFSVYMDFYLGVSLVVKVCGPKATQLILVLTVLQASLVAQLVKNLPSMPETWVWSLGWEDPLEKGKATTPAFWPREFHGLYSSWGHKESDTTERLYTNHFVWKAFKLINKRKIGFWLVIFLGYVVEKIVHILRSLKNYHR